MSIPYPSGYTIDANGIYHNGRALKGGKRGVYVLFDKEKRVRGSFSKWMYSAIKQIDIRKIPRDFSFSIGEDGQVTVEMFTDRMARIRREYHVGQERVLQDYQDMIDFGRVCVDVIGGGEEARNRLFAMLNARRDEIIRYAKDTLGGRGFKAAQDLADRAILYTYDSIIAQKKAVISPVAFAKRKVNNLIHENRRKRAFETLGRKKEYKYAVGQD